MTQNTQTTAEKMANLAHEIWARWMRYMFTKCIFQTDGGILIPGKMAERWTRQMETRYPDLPESEKQSDRDIANEYMFCAEIDALTRERDEARAEVAKLKERNRVLATTSLRDVIKSVHPSGRARGQ